MTCAKVRVFARLLTLDGEEFIGENLCDNPQTTCPRGPGEGYEKCRSICHQKGHAEIMAIEACRAAGCDPVDGSMTVNYHYFCNGCQTVMKELGIRY